MGNDTFNMVRDRTSEMVLQTIILRGVSLFFLGNLAATSLDLSLVSKLGSNTGKASSSEVGSPVGDVLVSCLGKDLSKGTAFPAVEVSGLLF